MKDCLANTCFSAAKKQHSMYNLDKNINFAKPWKVKYWKCYRIAVSYADSDKQWPSLILLVLTQIYMHFITPQMLT